jgi:hypothetical protein
MSLSHFCSLLRLATAIFTRVEFLGCQLLMSLSHFLSVLSFALPTAGSFTRVVPEVSLMSLSVLSVSALRAATALIFHLRLFLSVCSHEHVSVLSVLCSWPQRWIFTRLSPGGSCHEHVSLLLLPALVLSLSASVSPGLLGVLSIRRNS